MTKTVHVAKPFTLNLGGGREPVQVQAGIQPLPDEIAEHWYAKLHFAGGGITGEQYAKGSRDGTDAQYVAAKEAFALYVAMETTTLEAEASAGVEPTEPACTRLEGWPDEQPVIDAYNAAMEAYKERQEPDEPESDAEHTEGKQKRATARATRSAK